MDDPAGWQQAAVVLIGDDLAAALPELRQHAESRMTSTADVRRRTGVMAQDPDTGREYPVWTVVHAAIPLRVSGAGKAGVGSTVQTSIPGGTVNRALLTAHFPASTTDLRDGDLIEVTAGETAGLVLEILESDPSDQKTARRVSVRSVQRPERWS